MTVRLDRRQFIGATLASSAFTLVPRSVLGGPEYVAPSEKITLAHIGMGTQGFNELGGLLDDPRIQIVAVCDPNRDSNDYVEWGRNGIRNRIRNYMGNPSWGADRRGCPGGREVGRQVVDAYYQNHRGAGTGTGCRAYADYRELLDTEKDVDAVKVMTPDHLHATIAITVMKKGKHVLMHKPIANRLAEGRLVLETQRQTKRATHLLAYGSGADNGRIAEKIKQGVIGPLREIHNWSNRPVWPQYPVIPSDRPPIPEGFDWDLWLGPAEERPYHPHYTHTVFRGWYDFGGGSMADMGIYSLWPIFVALELDAPVSAQAWASHTCAITDHVSHKVHNDYSYPAACNIRLEFAARGDQPALDLFWYDGGMKPRLPREVEAHDIEMSPEGILFVGDEGIILAGFHGESPRLFSKGKVESLNLEDGPAPADAGAQRHEGWIRACQGGAPSPGAFEKAASITDAVNLGTVALRAGKKIRFDSQAMTIINAPDANKYLTRVYRKGWEL